MINTVNVPRIVIGAAGSGNGKTTITCGLLQSFMNRQLKVASFKCGPDYIDPMFHSRVIGTKSRNLDSFFTNEETTRYVFAKAAKDMDIAVMEGVMGYYDGLGGISCQASTYEIATITKSPAILVINGKGMSVSIVAMIKGFLDYQRDSHIKGIILNHVSPLFYETMKNMIEEQLPIKVYGYVPNLESFHIESRHLGLISPEEIGNLEEQMQELSGILEKTIDIQGILGLAEQAEELEFTIPNVPSLEQKVRIAVARDEAFSFYYEDNYELLTQMGAEICYFSPLEDIRLPQDVHGLWIGGGYPERYAKRLSENAGMRNSMKEAILNGMPCIAECGGFLYLHQDLESDNGNFYKMVGIIPARAYKTVKLQRFGYIELEAVKDSVFGKKGIKFPAHEFHYWESELPGDDYMAIKPLKKLSYGCIHARQNLVAGFPHMYLYANTEGAFHYLKACAEYKCMNQLDEENYS